MTLEVQNLTVIAPGGTIVLDRVSISIASGECLAVVGESGAGKSVLARTLLGLTQQQPRWRTTAEQWSLQLAPPTPADDGILHPGGSRDLRRIRPREWRRLRGDGIGLVLQDALQSLDPLRTIESEIGETLAIRGVRRGERRERAIWAMEQAGLPDPEGLVKRRSEQLSGGMRQRALIASALIGDPALIIADEPTTALDPVNSARILELFRRQCDDGRALLLISHDLRAVQSIADRIAVLDGGSLVEVGTADEIMRHPKHTATQRLVAAIPHGRKPREPGDQAPSIPREGASLIAVGSVSRSFDGGAGVHDIDLEIHRAEAIGLVGESGAGKTTLARLIVGADRPDAGEIRVAPGTRVRLIPQDPLSTFDPRWRVERIIASSISPGSGHTPSGLLESVGLAPAMLSRRPATLSGGERQRVAIARALAAGPDVLVCDEPVSALDVSTQAGVLELLRELQRRGVAIVFVSHDLAAVRTVCDRVVVLQEGRVSEEGPTERILAQ